jgi:hypothetical protein
MPTSAEDFHGDGGHGEVDVVATDRLLRYWSLPKLREPYAKFSLIRGNKSVEGILGGMSLPLERATPELLLVALDAGQAVATSGSSLIRPSARGGRRDAAGTGFGRFPFHPELSCFSGGAQVHSGPTQPYLNGPSGYAVLLGQLAGASASKVLLDDLVNRDVPLLERWDAPAVPFSVQSGPAYAERGRDLLNRLSSQIELDCVVQVRRLAWSGHVYNLSSVEGWYSAANIILSNCDCIHLPSRQASAAGILQDPKVIYDTLTPAERQRAGWSLADQKAIGAGADLNQVTNAKRGVYTAGGVKYTTTATTRRGLFGGFDIDAESGRMTARPRGAPPKLPRLTPESIYKQANGDRDVALRLLRENGYLKPVVVDGRIGLTPLPKLTGSARVANAASGDAALRAVPSGLRTATLTRAQSAALRDYQSSFYYAINGQLRRSEVGTLVASRVAGLDSAMAASKLARDVRVWRGITNSDRLFGAALERDMTGLEWRELAYTSTSADEHISAGFTYPGTGHQHPVLMRVFVPRGTGALTLGYAQQEILLQRGLRFRVVRDRGVSPRGFRLLDVEVVL